MKKKMILPLMAVMFALAGAFASAPLAQSGWFNDDGEVEQGTITIPANKVCETGRNIQCMIGVLPAYNTQSNAQSQIPSGLLKYNN